MTATPGEPALAHGFLKAGSLSLPLVLTTEPQTLPVGDTPFQEPGQGDGPGPGGLSVWWDADARRFMNPEGRLFDVRLGVRFEYATPDAAGLMDYVEDALGVATPKNLVTGLRKILDKPTFEQYVALHTAMQPARVLYSEDVGGALGVILRDEMLVPYTRGVPFVAARYHGFFGGETMRQNGMQPTLALSHALPSPVRMTAADLFYRVNSAPEDLTPGT